MLLFEIPNLILIAAAVIPAAALLLYVYKSDRLDKEPPSLLGLLILNGILATILAAWTEQIGVHFLNEFLREDTMLYNVLLNFLIVGLAEEGFKYLLLYRRTWESPDFNCQFDAVVYAVFVSLGFALWENIEYVIYYGFSTALIRAVTAIPGHACFGVFMGAWYGLAKAHERKGHAEYAKISRWLAVICPALLHGLYDLIATLEHENVVLYFIAFIAVMFLFAYRTIRQLSRNDKFI